MPQQPKPASESGRPAAERQFVDREEPIAIFQAALKALPCSKPLVLVFHGGAGIGKSRLRHELVRQSAVDPNVVAADLDFAIPSYRQPESALFFLRKALREVYQVRFPSFDLAYAVLWQKTHPDTPMGLPPLSAAENGGCTQQETVTPPCEELRTLLEPGSLLSQLLDDSGKLPLIGLIPRISSLVGKSPEPPDPRTPEPPLRAWWTERGERELEDLPQMEPAAIVECLPKLWAADLKDFLGATSHKPQAESEEPVRNRESESYHQDTKAQVRDDGRATINDERRARRAALFIDSYEKLSQTENGVRDTVDANQKTDAWVRELVKQLPEALWVISGRQKLRWEEVEKEWSDVLSQHELGALPEHSAREFLSSCGITDEPIRDAIAKGSQGVPHYLNLAVDTFLEIKQSGQRVPSTSASSSTSQAETPEELFAQFIRHLDQPEIATLQVLSASRFWNYGLFEHLVTEYQTGYPLTAYDDLSRFSFIGEGAAPETRTMHELTREALQEHQAPELRRRVHLFLHELYAKQLEGLDAKSITEKHKAALTEAFYHGRQAKSAEELWTWFVPVSQVFGKAWEGRLLVPLHREMIQALETQDGPDHPSTARAISGLASSLAGLAEYDEAEPLMWRSLRMREKMLGLEHPDTGDSLNLLSILLRQRYRFAEAEPLVRRSLTIAEKAFGPAHHIVGRRLGSLSSVMHCQGKYDEAEPLRRSALAILERTRGSDHPETAIEMHDLARLLHLRGKFAEGEQFSRRALAIFEKALGPDAVDVATALETLAGLLHDQGKAAEIESLYRRSLAIKEKTLGPSHPETVLSMNCLACCLKEQRKYEDAEPLAQRVLTLWEKALGPEHPNVSFGLANLSELFEAQGRYAEAESAARRALAIREKALGPDNDDVADALGVLARWLHAQTRYAEAESLERRAIAIMEKATDPEHPDVALHLDSLSNLLREQRRYPEAEDLARRALAIREAKSGPDNTFVAGTLDVLADSLAPQGKHAEAESSARRSLTIREKALGPEDPDVADSLEPLAAVLVRQSRYAEAEPLARRALAIREATLDPGHPDITRPLDILAELCEKTGRTSEAEALYRRALAIREKVFGPDHTFVAQPLEGLAKVCEQTGRTAEAQELSARAQRIRAQAETAPTNPQQQT